MAPKVEKKPIRQPSIASFFSPQKLAKCGAPKAIKTTAKPSKAPDRDKENVADDVVEQTKQQVQVVELTETPVKAVAASSTPKASTARRTKRKPQTVHAPKQQPQSGACSSASPVNEQKKTSAKSKQAKKTQQPAVKECCSTSPEAATVASDSATSAAATAITTPAADGDEVNGVVQDGDVMMQEVIDLTPPTPSKAKQSTPKKPNQPPVKRARRRKAAELEVVAYSASPHEMVPITASPHLTDTPNSIASTASTPQQATATGSTPRGPRSKKLKKSLVKKQAQQNQQKQQTPPKKEPAKPAAKPVVQLDPATKARLDGYVQKMNALATEWHQLLGSEDAEDAIMQELYGLRSDIGMELAKDEMDAIRRSAEKVFGGAVASSSGQAVGSSAAVGTEFPGEIKNFLARSVQGKSDSLSSLSNVVMKAFASFVTENSQADGANDDQQVIFSAGQEEIARIEMEIKMLAQRVSYGVRPKDPKTNVFEDTESTALWIWEVGNVEKFFVAPQSLKVIKLMRKHRRRVGQHVRTLDRVIQLLSSHAEDWKVSGEEAKLSRFYSQIESEQQKLTEKQRKVESQEAKKKLDEAKALAKAQEEQEKLEKAAKQNRRASLFSYFTAGAGAGATGASPEMVESSAAPAEGEQASGQQDVIDDTDKMASERMAHLDAAFECVPVSTEQASESAMSSRLSCKIQDLVESRSHNKLHRTKTPSSSWSGKRSRDPTLGIMKLLQFHDNHRPAYYGTFSKKSAVFRRGRRPFAHFDQFDYTVDSDDEWEEEEPGESLSSAEDDDEDNDNDLDQLDYGDQWLAYEDEVDYITDPEDSESGEGDDDGDEEDNNNSKESPMTGQESNSNDNSTMQGKKRKKKLKKIVVASTAGSSNKRRVKQLTHIEPRIVGPFVSDTNQEEEVGRQHFAQYQSERLVATPSFDSPLIIRARQLKLQQELQKQREEQQLQQRQQQQHQQLQASGESSSPNKQQSRQKQARRQEDKLRNAATKKLKKQESPDKEQPPNASEKPPAARHPVITSWFHSDPKRPQPATSIAPATPSTASSSLASMPIMIPSPTSSPVPSPRSQPCVPSNPSSPSPCTPPPPPSAFGLSAPSHGCVVAAAIPVTTTPPSASTSVSSLQTFEC